MEHGAETECVVCGVPALNKLFEVREMMVGTGDVFKYLQCESCGSLQIKDPSVDISKYYGAGYYSMSGLPSDKYKNVIVRTVRKLRDSYEVFGRGAVGQVVDYFDPGWARVMQTLRPLAPTKDSRILDVGCGNGVLLYSLRNIGFKNLLGVDKFLDRDIDFENGLRILHKSVDELDEGDWDVIMLHHSLEHMSNPGNVLNKIFSLLCKSGMCLIRIPIVSNFAWEKYGTSWIQLDAPRHFVIFSLKGLRGLAERVGFHLERVDFDSSEFQFWGSEQNAKGIALLSSNSYWYGLKNSIFTKDQIKRWKQEASVLNREMRGDQAVIYLRKS